MGNCLALTQLMDPFNTRKIFLLMTDGNFSSYSWCERNFKWRRAVIQYWMWSICWVIWSNIGFPIRDDTAPIWADENLDVFLFGSFIYRHLARDANSTGLDVNKDWSRLTARMPKIKKHLPLLQFICNVAFKRAGVYVHAKYTNVYTNSTKGGPASNCRLLNSGQP